jgi:HEAT repeat protein
MGKDLGPLMAELASEDGSLRKEARAALVALGKPVVSSLAKALRNSGSKQLRWEAAKALGEIGAPRSIPILVKALEDKDSDVAWLSAEALNALQQKAWPELLRAIMKAGPHSESLRRGAHHVLLNQKEEGFDDLLAALLKDLEPTAVREAAPMTAFAMLKRMKARP